VLGDSISRHRGYFPDSRHVRKPLSLAFALRVFVGWNCISLELPMSSSEITIEYKTWARSLFEKLITPIF
jgi:hypothetical protein